MLNSPRDKKEGSTAVVGRGEEAPLCDPGSELLQQCTGRERESNARMISEMKKKQKKNCILVVRLLYY